MWKKRRPEPQGKETVEITAFGGLEALEVGWVVAFEAPLGEAWCRSQDLEWGGGLLLGSELLIAGLQAAVKPQLLQNGEFLQQPLVSWSVMILVYYKLLKFVQFYFFMFMVCAPPLPFPLLTF